LLPLQKAPTAKVCDPNPEASELLEHGATMILKNLQLVSPKKNANHQTGQHFKTHIVIPSF
jgi:hypothetical protein